MKNCILHCSIVSNGCLNMHITVSSFCHLNHWICFIFWFCVYTYYVQLWLSYFSDVCYRIWAFTDHCYCVCANKYCLVYCLLLIKSLWHYHQCAILDIHYHLKRDVSSCLGRTFIQRWDQTPEMRPGARDVPWWYLINRSTVWKFHYNEYIWEFPLSIYTHYYDLTYLLFNMAQPKLNIWGSIWRREKKSFLVIWQIISIYRAILSLLLS